MSSVRSGFAEAVNGLLVPQRLRFNEIPSVMPDNWEPDPERELLPEVTGRPLEHGWVDLDTLATNKLITIGLAGAIYGVRRFDDEHIKLWCSRGGMNRRDVPFIGKVANLGVVNDSQYNPGTEELSYYPGIIASRSSEARTRMFMPYFAFDDEGNLLPPKGDTWMGEVAALKVDTIPFES